MRVTLLNSAVVAAVWMLSGCEALDGALWKPSSATPDRPDPVVQSAPQPKTRTAAVDPIPKPGVKPRPSVAGVNPKTLIGKSQSEAEAILGPPAVVHNAPPATIWRYTADGCTLDLFFYMDLGTNSLRALEYDAKTANGATSDEAIAQCVGLVQVTNRARHR